MRVASQSFYNQFSDQVQNLARRQSRLQTQAATGQRIHTADDDPAAMKRLLDLQAESARVKQYDANIESLKEKVSASYHSMRGLKTISDRLGELAALSDGTKSADELKIFATEANQLIEQAVQFVNSRHGEEYLFGGTRTEKPPFEATKDASGNITGVAYQGNGDSSQVEISEGISINVQVAGVSVAGSPVRGLVSDASSGADLFKHMIEFRDHLLAGDVQSIATNDRAALAKDENNLIYQIGTNAALQARLVSAKSITSDRASSVDNLVSKEANADLASTLVQLNQTQTAYQAALQSGSSIMRLSLLDYLR